MISVNNNNSQEEEESGIKINPAMKRRFELKIERDVAKCSKRCKGELRELLKLKERQRMSKKQLTLKILKG
jgi:hypothetical protein